jgi:hypothetical protein
MPERKRQGRPRGPGQGVLEGRGHPARESETDMAKGQKKSNKEIRKPKKEKSKKQNASNPSQKAGVVRGLDNMKND